MIDAYEKLQRDGKTAVLYSPGYGAGWYTWNPEHGPGLIFDKDIVRAVLNGDKKLALDVIEEKYPDAFTGGVDDLEVEWVDEGDRFEIEEYDGNESVRVFGPDEGFVA